MVSLAANRPRARKWLRWSLSGFLGLLVVLILVAYAFPHQVLCVDSGDVQADVIVELGGGSTERPTRAAELFKAGAAHRIIVSGAGDCQANQEFLIKLGVPADKIQLEARSTSTRENARNTIPMLRELGAKRVIVVTTWYHARRSVNCFEHYAPDIKFCPRPSYYAYPRAEWSREGVTHYIRTEYLKLAGYLLVYGIWPG